MARTGRSRCTFRGTNGRRAVVVYAVSLRRSRCEQTHSACVWLKHRVGTFPQAASFTFFAHTFRSDGKQQTVPHHPLRASVA